MITIYALAHPETFEVRYVGLTRDLHKRLRQYRLGHGHTKHLRNWVKSLPREPHSIVLEHTVDALGDKAERRWIGLYREAGARLLNYTDGGEGAFAWTPERRAEISEARKRWFAADPSRRGPMPAETKAKIAAAARGLKRPWSSETCRKRNAASKGVPWSAERKARRAAKNA